MNNNTRSLALSLLLPIVFAAACAETATQAPPLLDGTTADAATPDAATPDAATPDAAAPARYQGEVWLTQWDASFVRSVYGASTHAEFREADRDRLARECTTTTFGSCAVRRCANFAEAHHTDGDVYADPGRLTVDGLRGVPLPADLFTARTGGSVALMVDALWEGGERITLRSVGATPGVGAFVTDLTSPSPITLTSPSLDGGRLDRGVDGFDVTWTGGASGLVRVQLGQTYTGVAESVRVRCEAPASEGRVEVPAAALAQLPALANTPLYVMSVGRSSVATDDLALSFELRTVARFDQVALR